MAMRHEHHNVTGQSPTISEGVRLFHANGLEPRVRPVHIAGAVRMTAAAVGPRGTMILAALTASGFSFTHTPPIGAGDNTHLFDMLAGLDL